MEAPVLDLYKNDFHNSTYSKGNYVYRVVDLVNHEDRTEEFDLPLAGIDLGNTPFEIRDFDDFLFQIARVKSCDFKYPIILDDLGFICDGWHRVAKAFLEGRSTIKAVRLLSMPEPTKIEDEE